MISFDDKKGLHWIDDRVEDSTESLAVLLSEGRDLSRQQSNTTKLQIRELNLAYYDNCLVQYCRDWEQGRAHRKTCWVKNCENVVSLGRGPISEESIRSIYPRMQARGVFGKFLFSIARRFAVSDTSGWVFLKYLPPLDFSLRATLSRMKYAFVTGAGLRSRDRVMDVVDSIRKSGLSADKASTPHHSVFIYYRKYDKYAVMTGRHRVAAARYLYELNEIPEDSFVNGIVISVPWDYIRTSRPYPGVAPCERCSCKR